MRSLAISAACLSWNAVGAVAAPRGAGWDLLVDETSGAMSRAVRAQGGYLLFDGCAAP